jgi:hypothetical protein
MNDDADEKIDEVVVALDEHDAKIAEQEAAVKKLKEGVKEECSQS